MVNFSNIKMIFNWIMTFLNGQKKELDHWDQKSRSQQMIQKQLIGRGILNAQVIRAMEHVPRHLFVPVVSYEEAYEDRPLPIGFNQTISQPYIVALMAELAQLKATSKVLEIGTGSGYLAAVLSLIAKKVFTMEYNEILANTARKRLKDLKFDNIEVGIGQGYLGWKEYQPFDSILVSAAIDHPPQAIVKQLKSNGTLVIPLERSNDFQELVVIKKNSDGILSQRSILPVRFVPFVRSE